MNILQKQSKECRKNAERENTMTEKENICVGPLVRDSSNQTLIKERPMKNQTEELLDVYRKLIATQKELEDANANIKFLHNDSTKINNLISANATLAGQRDGMQKERDELRKENNALRDGLEKALHRINEIDLDFQIRINFEKEQTEHGKQVILKLIEERDFEKVKTKFEAERMQKERKL